MWVKVGDKRVNFNLVGRGGGGGDWCNEVCKMWKFIRKWNEIFNIFI